MKTKSQKPSARIWMGAVIGFALLFMVAAPRTAQAQWTTSGNDISNTNSGNVGIGTSTPAHRLDVLVNAQWVARFKKSDSTNGGIIIDAAASYNPNVALAVNGTNKWYLSSNSGNSDAFQFLDSSGTARFTLTQAGNVGIGTTAPEADLSFEPAAFTASVEGIKFQSSDNDTDSILQALKVAAGGINLIIGANAYISTAGVNSRFNTSAATAMINTRSSDGTIRLFTNTSSGNPVERMQIDSAGNVGIGTTAPAGILDLKQSNAGGSTILRVFNSAGSGTTEQAELRFIHSDFFGSSIHSGRESNYSSGATADSFLALYTALDGTDVERMRISSTGNVGIGTTAPIYKLDVAGEVRSSTGGFRFPDGTVQTTAASGGAVASVFGRTGAVVAATNDYTWAQIDKTTSSLANLTTRSAGDLSSGTLPDARFPSTLPAASGANLTALNASSLASGTLPDARFPTTLPAASGANLTALNASSLASGTLPDARFPATLPAASGVNLTALSASSLASGTVATARLGSGTADGTTFLRGDNTWAVPSGGSQWTTSGSDINYAPSGNVGIGTSSPTFKLHVTGNGKFTGNLTVDGNIAAKYQDVAEWVPAAEELAVATVVVLDTTKSNHVTSSTISYDTRVAGVISAQPGIALGEDGAGRVLVATTGRVLVQVDASRGAIHIGDLLVTSDIRGVAMKSEPVNLSGIQLHRPGTIIGKALEPLEKGSGRILVLLSLQ